MQTTWEGSQLIPQCPGLCTSGFRETGTIPFIKCYLVERNEKLPSRSLHSRRDQGRENKHLDRKVAQVLVKVRKTQNRLRCSRLTEGWEN